VEEGKKEKKKKRERSKRAAGKGQGGKRGRWNKEVEVEEERKSGEKKAYVLTLMSLTTPSICALLAHSSTPSSKAEASGLDFPNLSRRVI
jgi:hypothetical protein